MSQKRPAEHVDCPKCGGTGEIGYGWPVGIDYCDLCGGSGEVTQNKAQNHISSTEETKR